MCFIQHFALYAENRSIAISDVDVSSYDEGFFPVRDVFLVVDDEDDEEDDEDIVSELSEKESNKSKVDENN